MDQGSLAETHSPVYRFFNRFADIFAFVSLVAWVILPIFFNFGKLPAFYLTVSILALFGSFGYLSRKIMKEASWSTNLSIVIYAIIGLGTFYFFLIS